MQSGSSPTNSAVSPPPLDPGPVERMRALIDHLSGYIELYHGGRVEFVTFDGETLVVRMSGACEGCRLSPTTLHGWIEGSARQFFPGLRQVVAA